jgi:hypothetical protein
MSTPETESDWRAGLDETDAALIDDYQSGFRLQHTLGRACRRKMGVVGLTS